MLVANVVAIAIKSGTSQKAIKSYIYSWNEITSDVEYY
jgi:hypothetical protein